MKKIIPVIMIGLLLVGINVYAQGDLVVNGQLGVGGITSALYQASFASTNLRGLTVNAATNTNTVGGGIDGAKYGVTINGSTSTDSLAGQIVVLNMMSDLSGTVPGGLAASYTFQIGTPDSSGTTDVTRVVGLQYTLNRHYNNTRTYNVADSYGFLSTIQEGSTGGTAVNVTNHYHQYLDDAGLLSKVNITNLYGMYIEKMTGGTNNYGLVLDGDGAGADILFGPNQEARIYSDLGRLYAQDSFGNQTILSPHDPETGEWVYYSKNIKTGKIVQVDMAKLVKAVEKLTGETFMVETLIEDK